MKKKKVRHSQYFSQHFYNRLYVVNFYWFEFKPINEITFFPTNNNP